MKGKGKQLPPIKTLPKTDKEWDALPRGTGPFGTTPKKAKRLSGERKGYNA